MLGVVELAGFAAAEAHFVGLPAAVDLDVEAGGEGVDDGGADAVEASGGRVGAAAELAARVELGVDDLDAGQALAGDDVNGDAAPVVCDGGGVVGVQAHVDGVAVSLEGLVDGVVNDLPQAVHEAPVVGGADVHAGALAHGLEPLEDREVARVVVGCVGRSHVVHHRRPCPRLWPPACVARVLGRFPRVTRPGPDCAGGRRFGGAWALAAAARFSPAAGVGRAVARLRRR